MESHDQDPTTPAGAPAGSEDPTTAPRPAARRLYKSRDDRMIGGVCGGLAEYFGIDPVIVRVIAVALVFAGGAGLLAYVAAWLLVPEYDAEPGERPGRTATIVGAVALVAAVGALLPLWNGPFGGHWSGPFVGLVFVGLAGLGVWYLASGEQPAAGGVRDVLRRAGFGLSLLAVCAILAVGGAWASAAGGGAIVAGVIVVVGLWLVVSAFVGGSRWLILPALALALPAGVVSAANLDVHGGVGERQYRPVGPAQVRDSYRLGIGQLIVDLRDAKLPAGDRRVHIDLGVGQAVLVVPRDACVSTAAKLGAGQVSVFDRNSGGVDIDWQDERTAPAGTTRIVVDGDVGVGQLAVTYQGAESVRREGLREELAPGNRNCIGGARG